MLGFSSLITASARPLAAATNRIVMPTFAKPVNACILTPSETEGPYYFNAALLRQDITEGRPGFPTKIGVQVVRASTCAPVPNAIVDIWHCDAGGIYAGYSGQGGGADAQGDNFLRGIQVTDANGSATFLTLYPGWYQGRTQHIHFKVILNNQTLVTSQWFFSDTTTDEIYGIVEPYNARAARGTRNANDMLYNPQLELTLTPDKGGIAGAFTIVVA